MENTEWVGQTLFLHYLQQTKEAHHIQLIDFSFSESMLSNLPRPTAHAEDFAPFGVEIFFEAST